jgi:hypothetical protein
MYNDQRFRSRQVTNMADNMDQAEQLLPDTAPENSY